MMTKDEQILELIKDISKTKERIEGKNYQLITGLTADGMNIQLFYRCNSTMLIVDTYENIIEFKFLPYKADVPIDLLTINIKYLYSLKFIEKIINELLNLL